MFGDVLKANLGKFQAPGGNLHYESACTARPIANLRFWVRMIQMRSQR